MPFNHKIINKDSLHILAVSGGPDSMFLLDNMRCKEYKVVVAHVNYKKRAESDYDEEIVKKYCQKYSLPLEIYCVKGTEYIHVKNFQDKARQIRYDFFQEIANKYQTKHIVIAHHLDDHLETYLLQKKRNSLVSYWGLSPKTKRGNYWIYRPLLSFAKQQIYQYLFSKKLDYANDITNQSLIYQRNIVRQKVNSLKKEEKENLKKEIDEQNHELKKTKRLLKTITKKLITFSWNLIITKKNEYSKEVYLRLLYFWINQATNGILQQGKKQLLAEVYKQLFTSKKKKLIIALKNNFQVIKYNNQATIKIKNN